MITRDDVYAAALAELAADGLAGADRFILVHIEPSSDGDAHIHARRFTRDWVQVDALLGRGADDDLSAGVERAIDALWPECSKSARRMLSVVAHGVSKLGGGLFSRKKR